MLCASYRCWVAQTFPRTGLCTVIRIIEITLFELNVHRICGVYITQGRPSKGCLHTLQRKFSLLRAFFLALCVSLWKRLPFPLLVYSSSSGSRQPWQAITSHMFKPVKLELTIYETVSINPNRTEDDVVVSLLSFISYRTPVTDTRCLWGLGTTLNLGVDMHADMVWRGLPNMASWNGVGNPIHASQYIHTRSFKTILCSLSRRWLAYREHTHK